MSCDVKRGIVLGGKFWASKMTAISDRSSQIDAMYEYAEISHTPWVFVFKNKLYFYTPGVCRFVRSLARCQEPPLSRDSFGRVKAKHWTRECLEQKMEREYILKNYLGQSAKTVAF